MAGLDVDPGAADRDPGRNGRADGGGSEVAFDAAPQGLDQDPGLAWWRFAGGLRVDAEGEAGLFDRIRVEGTVDPKTGQVALRAGELVRLTLSKALRDRLPAAVGRAFGQAGLESGEIDADLPSLTFDPTASPRIHYQATAKLRRGL